MTTIPLDSPTFLHDLEPLHRANPELHITHNGRTVRVTDVAEALTKEHGWKFWQLDGGRVWEMRERARVMLTPPAE
jgi:hypothetical protein